MNYELFNKDILYKLKENQNILPFLHGLRQSELNSLIDILNWDCSLLDRLIKQPQHFNVLHKIWDVVKDKNMFMQDWLSMYDNPAAVNVNVLDACTFGQLSSKKWLIDKLEFLNLELGNVWILGGWIGSLAYLMFECNILRFEKIRSFDIDHNSTILSEILNNRYVVNNWQYKSTTIDVNRLLYDNFKYITFKDNGESQLLIETANTIINTSCDHMGDNYTWWDNIPTGKLVVLQNNDYVDIADHDNIVYSTDEFSSKYPMSELLYSGELDCKIYNRFMLIGRK